MYDLIHTYRDRLGEHTELRLHTNTESHLVMRNGSLVLNRTLKLAGTSARCYHRGRFGFSATPDLGSRGTDRVLKEAQANARLLAGVAGGAEDREAPLPETGPGRGSFDYRSARQRFTDRERVDLVRGIDADLRTRHPRILALDLTLAGLAIEKAVVTSGGSESWSYVPRANLVVSMALRHQGEIVELAQVFGGFGEIEDHFADPRSLREELERLYLRLEEKALGVNPEAGVHDVILDSSVAGILAHEAIGHTCEADMVLGGSIAGSMLGRPVASEKLTLVDFMARAPDGEGSIAIHVDDEGTPCRDVTLIKDGILTGFLHSRETARILGAEPTGNARAFRFNDEPLVRMRNTAILPGEDKLEDMIASIDHGYFLVQPTNGQADATSEFMFGIGFGYEIKGGKLGRAIRDTTVSGVAFDMLKTVTHVSRDLTWSKGGMCGKKQPIPVGMGGPALACRIHVGGR